MSKKIYGRPVTTPYNPDKIKDEKGINWKGEWGIGNSYVRNDAVYHSGSSYIYLNSSAPADVEPGTDETVWQLLVAKGKDGYTPVKGDDYWTEEDKEELVDSVLAELPTWEGGSY